MNDLVKRLRHGVIKYPQTDATMNEAADRIEELEKQIKTDALQYLSDVGQMQDRIEEMEAKTASRTDNTQTIKIIDYIENEDGSATVKLDITQRTAQMLMEVGFLKILKDHIERTEDE